MKKSCVTACPVEWPEGRGISGRMRVEWVAGSTWNRWSDAHGMGGQMTVESAGVVASRYEDVSGRCILNVFDSCHFADSPDFIVAKCFRLPVGVG